MIVTNTQAKFITIEKNQFVSFRCLELASLDNRSKQESPQSTSSTLQERCELFYHFIYLFPNLGFPANLLHVLSRAVIKIHFMLILSMLISMFQSSRSFDNQGKVLRRKQSV